MFLRSSNMPKIYIDADGCPVVYLTLEIAEEYALDCCIVCDSSHAYNIDGVEVITVDQGNDSADYRILNLLKKDDIVITQDYGLAAMALAKKAKPLSQNGIVYTEENIDGMLHQRHHSAKQRKATHRYPHIKKRTIDNDEKFISSLKNLLNTIHN